MLTSTGSDDDCTPSLQTSTRRSPSPLLFTLQSYDKQCYVSFLLEWTDSSGERHTWHSWSDALCGFYKSRKILPASSTNIRVSFAVEPGKRKMCKVDRRNKCAWVKDNSEEVIWLRAPDSEASLSDIDVTFEARGGVLGGAHIWRAWNALNGGSPEDWEYWPSFECTNPFRPPRTLQEADKVAPCAHLAQSQILEVVGALQRLRAAAATMCEVRKETQVMLLRQDAKVTKQWVGVNSTRTAAAGLALGAFGTLVAAPVAAASLGVGSVAVGVGALSADRVGDHSSECRFSRVVRADLYEQLGFESVESELRLALQKATPARKHRNRAAKRQMYAVGSQVSTVLAVEGVRLGIRSGRIATLSTRAASGVSVTSQVLSGVGAGLAVGVAIHGWSTTKPTQKMIREKLSEVESSITYLKDLQENTESVLQCAVCSMPLDFNSDGTQLRRCEYFHCFHASCLNTHVGKQQEHMGESCPVCPKDTPGGRLSDFSGPAEQLRALLWRSGVREHVGINADSLEPEVLKKAKELCTRAPRDYKEADAAEKDADTRPTLSRGFCVEDAETHEVWIQSSSSAGSVSALAVSLVQLDKDVDGLQLVEALLVQGTGCPLKYRLSCWPVWLNVERRKARAEESGKTFTFWLDQSTDIPDSIKHDIDADVPRTRDRLQAPQRHLLARILRAFAACFPSIGYSQGLNHVTGVLLTLGFEREDDYFYMLSEIISNIVPDCHSKDLRGFYRDAAVGKVLLTKFLPMHARAIDTSGCELHWIALDYFLTLGTKDMCLPLLLRLWDFCFLYGPCALFSGFLAHIELCFPTDASGVSGDDEEDPELVMANYREASRALDPAVFVKRLVSFLFYRQGGISEELILELRSAFTPKE